ncbi:MAG: hypothetical protein HN986_01390 [Candidatus Marinimicrobia bacterium]|jgi:hypothetical protein|nr:hypothetical protein [Candidatus Neomarinimicrobiota bacterium]
MNINEAYTSINAVVLNEKFDERKAEVTLKDLKMVYGQAKMIGASKAAQDELKRVYSRLVSDWFGHNEAGKRKIPTELK